MNEKIKKSVLDANFESCSLQAENFLEIKFPALPENEALARAVAGAFVSGADPLLSELSDIRTVVSEAVTNAIIHGYAGDPQKLVHMRLALSERTLRMEIRDDGIGIEDIERAREPLYTSRPAEERSGLGFSVMEAFTDNLEVISSPGQGTTIKMLKVLE